MTLPVPAFWFATRPWLDNASVAGAAPPIMVRNPATGGLLAEVERADAEVVTRAIDAAAAAQRRWARVPAASRGGVLLRLAGLLAARRDEFAPARSTTR